MTDRERNRYDALKRTKKFKVDNAADFPAAGSPSNVKATALFATIDAAILNVEAAIAGRATASAQFHGGTVTETVKRSALMLDLAELNRAAAAMAEADGTPGLMEDFRMPWGASDTELPGQARAMIAKASSMSARFVELEFPANFATQLEARVVEFETAGATQDAGLSQQAGYTGAFEDLLSPGLAALKQLDVISRRRFRTNAVKLGAWATASHIERLSSGQSSGGGNNGGGTPPEPPQAPQNFSASLTGSGGEATANADPSDGATEYRVYAGPPNTTPTLKATSATLPVTFTLDPGTWEITMTAVGAGGESEPTSPPVTLTVE